jgi:ATP-dependent helicase HrpB
VALPTLPIDGVLGDLVAAIRDRGNAVLRAPTGAGKTTRVPPALLDAGLAGGKRIVVLEPRRLAARAAARRIAQERGGELGGEVGYHVRFDRRAGKNTKILIVTEGMLVRELQGDPFLEQVGIVVFDEFHERNLDGDLALAMSRRVQREARPDLRIVAMSATLDAAPLAAFLGNAPIVESQGKLFPVEIRHRPYRISEPLDGIVAAAVRDALGETPGDILVFLPGVGEIRRAREALAELERLRGLLVMELYGDLAPEEQDRVLRKADKRKVVLATNVAETSVTIDGVTGVIDSGLRRVSRLDSAVGLDRLELERISRSSADQRAGRAGRTAPGVCWRLWSELDARAMAPSDEPELRRVDLAGAALQLLAWGEADAAAFPWFEAPPARALSLASQLLERLGATVRGAITPLGRQMAEVPAHPRIARLLLEGRKLGNPAGAALAAAILTERDPFRRGGTPRKAVHHSSSDVVDRVHAVGELKRGGRRDADSEIRPGDAQFLLRARDQYLGLAGGGERAADSQLSGDEAILRALFAAFPDRLARRREAGSRRAVMVGGRGARLADSSAVADAELFVGIDVDAGASETLVRLASAVERGWIPNDRLTTSEDLSFDPTALRVVARRRLLFEDLVLEEARVNPKDPGAVSAVLLAAAAADPARALALDDPDLLAFLARVRSLRAWLPELGLPDPNPNDALPALCEGRSSFEELRKAPLLDHLRGALTHSQLSALEREAPDRLTVPSGSAIRLRYEPGRPPVLSVRIQELFGLAETPRIARGRVPVLLHLLAPNYRPEQITTDLKSFWNTTYPTIRGALRARYPRHSWPEDPWTAPPQRKPGGPPRRKR